MENQGIDMEGLNKRTEEFLSWVEEKQKKKGFEGIEIENLRDILEESLKLNSFSEVIEFVRDEIRKWKRTYWNPTKLQSIRKDYMNKTERAEVLEQFPFILIEFLATLDSVEQYVLEAEQEIIFGTMRQRMNESIEKLELKDSEKKVLPERKIKKPPRRSPRANK